MSAVEWHLDVVRHTDGTLYLAVLDPQSGLLEREKVTSARRHETVRALRTVMLRTCPNWPNVIVTDNAQTWFGVADALGVQRRTLEPTEQRVFERIVRSLLDRLFQDDAGQPVTFAEEQRKFQSERANRAEARIEALETALRSLGMTARLLFSNCSGCVVLHHAGDDADLPAWLTDCGTEIDKAHALLTYREARS